MLSLYGVLTPDHASAVVLSCGAFSTLTLPIVEKIHTHEVAPDLSIYLLMNVRVWCVTPGGVAQEGHHTCQEGNLVFLFFFLMMFLYMFLLPCLPRGENDTFSARVPRGRTVERDEGVTYFRKMDTNGTWLALHNTHSLVENY